MNSKVESIFRGYDIRGVYGKTLTEEVMGRIGRAFARFIEGDELVMARDGRLSGESLSRAFAEGVVSAGKDVTDLGVLPLGVGMYHAWREGRTFAFVTASHLEREWNGIKFFKSNGIGFMEDDLDGIRKSFLEGPGGDPGREGRLAGMDGSRIMRDYVKHLHSRIRPSRELKVVLDAGNGTAGLVVRELFRGAGFDASVEDGEVDGNFPSRSPDPLTDPLEKLRKNVDGKDVGIAYDGDGDRMTVIDENGKRVTPEQISYIMLSELLKEQPGPIVANVESTRTMDRIAGKFGRAVHRVRVGHNHLMKGTFEHGACFGMEPSGHYSVPSIFPFDDSLAISYYFACALSRQEGNLSEIVSGVPALPFGRVTFDVPDDRKFGVMESIKDDIRKRYRNVSTMDGARVDLEKGWVLIRPSNTGPHIRLTIEAETGEGLKALEEEFSDIVKKYI